MSKAQLSLEYIVRLMIILVVIAVVMSIIMKFKDDIRIWIDEFLGSDEKPNFPKIIDDKTTFSIGEITVYIEDCYYTMTSLPEDEQEDIVCYVLIPKEGFELRKEDLESVISNDIIDKVDIQTLFNRDVIKIQYQDLGNRILVSD